MTLRLQFPPEYVSTFYRENNSDLKDLSEIELISHFSEFGRQEGRVASPSALRENFVKLLPSEFKSLEIGPFCKPAIAGPNVSYFDVMDGKALRERAEKIGYPIDCVPDVEFVSPTGDLSIVRGVFDAVFSSHCIEHQPDLVYHLQQVERLLSPGGFYFLIIPDKRYCFDHPFPESNLADVLQAYHEMARVHSMRNVICHRALLTHNNQMRHWANDHSDSPSPRNLTERVQNAIEEFINSKGRYIDVHAWQFIPKSFKEILYCLRSMNLINLVPERIYDTPWGRNEFTAILRKPERQ